MYENKEQIEARLVAVNYKMFVQGIVKNTSVNLATSEILNVCFSPEINRK